MVCGDGECCGIDSCNNRGVGAALLPGNGQEEYDPSLEVDFKISGQFETKMQIFLSIRKTWVVSSVLSITAIGIIGALWNVAEEACSGKNR